MKTIKDVLINLCACQDDCDLKKGKTCNNCKNVTFAEIDIRELIERENRQSPLPKVCSKCGKGIIQYMNDGCGKRCPICEDVTV